jgi:uncharacterized phage-associated protein
VVHTKRKTKVLLGEDDTFVRGGYCYFGEFSLRWTRNERVSTPQESSKTMRFEAEKVTEAAALLLNLRGGRMHYIKLLKLLYIADREALAEWGIPVSHDSYVSMDNGPVLSQTYNLIKDGGRFWSDYISAPIGDYEVELTGGLPKTRKMSQAEENLLRRVFEEYGNKYRFDLVDYVHTFPEWQNPHGSSIPIPLEDILKALDERPEGIRAIVSELKQEREIEERLESACS